MHTPSERVTRTLLCVDVVESVRLIEDDEENAVRRWQRLMERVTTEVLPAHDGRLVKSLGDGMLLEFTQAPAAVAAAFSIQRVCRECNDGLDPQRHLLLRVGGNAGELISDQLDVYGHAVNLAARVTTLAGPGEIVVSAAVRDQLTPYLDADVEDLGECYLKHVREPVRAYRVGPPGERPVIASGTHVVPQLSPTVAVIPFAGRGVAHDEEMIGEVLADEVIAALSRSSALDVISRLSTTVFRTREATLAEVRELLHATYVVSGTYRTSGSRLVLTVELAEARTGHIVWAERLSGSIPAILEGEDSLIDRLVAEVGSAVLSRELDRAQTQALPTLESCTLLMGSIALMHRLSLREFDRARQMLQTLIERVPRAALPYAWLAKWHVLRMQQGWTDDPNVDTRLALDCTKRALDSDPRCTLAMAVDGLVHTHLLKRLDVAQRCYETAIEVNPSDSLAWLLKGTLHAFRGEGGLAIEGTERALMLSPLDPLKYYYDSLAATAALSSGNYLRALELAQRSLRANRTHTSTIRALAIAQWELGRTDEARATIADLRALEPGLTVSRWRARSPADGFAVGDAWAKALRDAGLPE